MPAATKRRPRASALDRRRLTVVADPWRRPRFATIDKTPMATKTAPIGRAALYKAISDTAMTSCRSASRPIWRRIAGAKAIARPTLIKRFIYGERHCSRACVFVRRVLSHIALAITDDENVRAGDACVFDVRADGVVRFSKHMIPPPNRPVPRRRSVVSAREPPEGGE